MANKNKSRKFFATATSAALVASAIVPVASAASFTDADKIGSWAKEAVDFLADKEIISGNPDGSFNPQGNVTRAEAAKMFTKALDLSTEGTEDFSDVTEGQWFYEFVVAVSNAGIVNGKGEGIFAPKANLTRAEAAKMIVEAYKLTGEADLSTFADANTVAGKWSEAYLSTAVANGVINGKDGKLAANDSISRQEFAVMLKRAIDVEEVNPAADLTEALTALETATNALPKEVTADTVTEAQAAVDAVKAAMTEAQTALDAAVKAEAVTEEEVTKAKAAIEAAQTAVTATEKAIEAAEEAAKELTVTSVTAISATQVEVKFSKAVDKATLFTNGESGELKALNASTVVSLTSLDSNAAGTLSGELSEDGKTLTITSQNVLSKRYDVVVDGLKSTDGKNIKKFEEMITVADDEKAPTITGTEQISANKVKINFSEPVKAHSSATLKYADGTTVTGASVSVTEGATSVIVDLSASTVEVNKPITITFIGLQDKAGNLITPNPATVEVTKLQVDGVKPTVSTITQTGAKTFNVKFSKDLAAAPTVTVSGYSVDSITKVSASEYKVTVTTNLTGVQNVTVAAGYTDLSGQAGEAVTKVVTFTQDTVAPKAISTKVVTVDGVEYLELAFDKEVTEGKITVEGSQTKDFVTTAVSSKDVDAKYVSTSNKTVVRTPLSGFATVEGAEYTLNVTSPASTGVTSLSGVAFEKTSVTFTRGKDVASNDTKLAAPVIAQGSTNDTVTVTFTGEVDGASATNIANYTVDGAVVEKATLAAPSGGKQVVTLTLKQDSNTFTGTRNITVENVKALGSSVTMDKFVEKTVSLNENVRATITKAELTSNQEITLTFSEAVYDTTNDAGKDFDLYIGGTKATATLTTENVAKGSAKNTLVLTITGTLTADDLAKGLSIKAATDVDVKDIVDNGLNIGTVTVTQ